VRADQVIEQRVGTRAMPRRGDGGNEAGGWSGGGRGEGAPDRGAVGAEEERLIEEEDTFQFFQTARGRVSTERFEPHDGVGGRVSKPFRRTWSRVVVSW
jgi:hypothetical protein